MKDFIEYFKEQNKQNPQIYCDMDGVLVDLIDGIRQRYGFKDLSNRNFDSYVDPIKPQIDKEHPNLFAELPWTKDGKQLWKYISRYEPNILSAHTTTWQLNSRKDKLHWIEKNLRPLPKLSHILMRRDKAKYAKTNGVANILIDDWSKNIDEWKAAGGIGIKHTSTANTITELKKLGF